MDKGYSETKCAFARSSARAFFKAESKHDVERVSSQCRALHKHIVWQGPNYDRFSFPVYYKELLGGGRSRLPHNFQYFLLCMFTFPPTASPIDLNYHVIGADMLIHAPGLGASLDELMCSFNQLRALHGGPGYIDGLVHGVVETAMKRDGVAKTVAAVSAAFAGRAKRWLILNTAHGFGHGLAQLWNASGFELSQLGKNDYDKAHDTLAKMYVPGNLPTQYRWMWGITILDGMTMVFVNTGIVNMFPRKGKVPSCHFDDVRCKIRLDFFLGWHYNKAGMFRSRTKTEYRACRGAGYHNHSCAFALGFGTERASDRLGRLPPPGTFNDIFASHFFLLGGHLRDSFNDGESFFDMTDAAAIDAAKNYCESHYSRAPDQGICKHSLPSARSHDTRCMEKLFALQR